MIISIHAPIVGCDDNGIFSKIAYKHISIHAPIVGCDHCVRLIVQVAT